MAGPGIIIKIEGDGSGAAEALRVIEERMKQTAQTGSEMSEQLQVAGERMQKALEYAGIGYGLREIVDGAKEMIQQSIELGMELEHLSQQTGISTEHLSVLKYMGEQTGVSFESLQKGFKKLSTELFEMQEGEKQARDAFGLLNITQKDLNETGGDTWKVMELVADRMAAMPDGWKKSAAAQQLYGRAGQELIPVMNQGSAAIEDFRQQAEDLGLVLNSQGVERMEEMYRAEQRVTAAMQGMALELANDLSPEVLAWSQGMDVALRYLRDWNNELGLGAGTANQKLPEIPKEILNSKDPQQIAWDSQDQRNAAVSGQKELQRQHDAKLISEAEFRQKMLALQKQYDEATQNEAAANATVLWKEISRLEDQTGSLRVKYDAGEMSLSSFREQMGDLEDQLKRKKYTEMHYLSEMEAAQNRLKGDSGPGAPDSDTTSKDNKAAMQAAELADKEQRLIDENARKELAQIEAYNRAHEALEKEQSQSSVELAQAQATMLEHILEGEHEAGLLNESDYYAQRLAIQKQAYAAERDALEAQQQQEETALKAERDPARQDQLKTKLLETETKLAQLKDREAADEAAITAEMERQEQANRMKLVEAQAHASTEAQQDTIAGRKRDADEAANTIGRFLDQVGNLKGKDPLRELTQEMIADMDRLAVEVLEKEWLIPMLESLFTPSMAGPWSGTGGSLSGGMAPGLLNLPWGADGGVPGFATGTDSAPDGLAMVGENGPELVNLPGGSRVISNDVLSSLAKGGGGAPSVVIHNTNNSSQPVEMRQTGVSYDSQLKQFVIHTALEDMQSGGPLSQALSVGRS